MATVCLGFELAYLPGSVAYKTAEGLHSPRSHSKGRRMNLYKYIFALVPDDLNNPNWALTAEWKQSLFGTFTVRST